MSISLLLLKNEISLQMLLLGSKSKEARGRRTKGGGGGLIVIGGRPFGQMMNRSLEFDRGYHYLVPQTETRSFPKRPSPNIDGDFPIPSTVLRT